MPNDYVTLTLNDNTIGSNNLPESTSFRLPVNEVTAANLAATETALGTLVTAVNAVTLGNLWKTQIGITEENPNTPAANAFAQREIKWFVTMTGGGEKKTFSIGTADLALLDTNSEYMEAGVPRDNLVAALNAIVKASDGTTAMAVQLPIVFKGRNT